MNDLSDKYRSLTTEQPNPASKNLDRLSPQEFLSVMQSEEKRVLEALEGVQSELAELIRRVASAIEAGGRLFYVGAGTSGRLGMLDATECPPTFGVPPTMVQAILAGGAECLVRSVEGAEDNRIAGERAIHERGATAQDVVLGIAASSATPFVQSALIAARRVGAYTGLLTCHENPQLDFEVDHIFVLRTGPEVLTGSTRLKAGTATKLFLNRLTTGVMVQLGKVYENRMVDLHLSCTKLKERAVRTTCDLTGLDRDAAIQLLEQSGGSVKVALVSHRLGIEPADAAVRLASVGGRVRSALGED